MALHEPDYSRHVALRLRGGGSAGAASSRNDVFADDGTSLKGVRVLVVDDIPDEREVLSLLLEHQGAEVLKAASAAEGLATLGRERPDVLLTDIGMPDADGYAFLRQVRELSVDRGGLTPVAAVTAFEGSDERERALAAGFKAYVRKPVDARALAKVVYDLTWKSCGKTVENGCDP
jgi:CheY-like chemotaxis protein